MLPPRKNNALPFEVQSALVIRTTFVPLCFSKKNVLITSGAYECSYNQRNYLVFWKSVPKIHVLITRFLYDVLITRVLITRVDCIWFTRIMSQENSNVQSALVIRTTFVPLCFLRK